MIIIDTVTGEVQLDDERKAPREELVELTLDDMIGEELQLQLVEVETCRTA